MPGHALSRGRLHPCGAAGFRHRIDGGGRSPRATAELATYTIAAKVDDDLDAPVAGIGRAEWLRVAAGKLRPYFVDRGVAFPERFRFAPHPVGGDSPTTLGLCHPRRRRIWIAFDRCAGVPQLLVVLVHELVHLIAVNDRGDGHGAEFARAAARLDLRRSKGVYIVAGPMLERALRVVEARLPPLPVDWVGPRPVRSRFDPRQWR
jgi:hypothetical protein